MSRQSFGKVSAEEPSIGAQKKAEWRSSEVTYAQRSALRASARKIGLQATNGATGAVNRLETNCKAKSCPHNGLASSVLAISEGCLQTGGNAYSSAHNERSARRHCESSPYQYPLTMLKLTACLLTSSSWARLIRMGDGYGWSHHRLLAVLPLAYCSMRFDSRARATFSTGPAPFRALSGQICYTSC